MPRFFKYVSFLGYFPSFFGAVGNIRLREFADQHVENFRTATTRKEKSLVVTEIVNTIQKGGNSSRGGLFVRKVCSSIAILILNLDSSLPLN